MGAGVGCLLPWLKKFKCWFSLTTLGICLFTLRQPSTYSFLLFASLDNCDFAVRFSNWPPDNKQIGPWWLYVITFFGLTEAGPTTWINLSCKKCRQAGPVIHFLSLHELTRRPKRKRSPWFAWIAPVCSVFSLGPTCECLVYSPVSTCERFSTGAFVVPGCSWYSMCLLK